VKRTLIIAIFISVAFTSYSQTDSITGRQFRLRGKIIEKVQLTPHCGDIAWATVLEFDVIKLEGMEKPVKRIGIIVPCPEFYIDNFFQEGKTYEVVFSDKNDAPFGWLIPNKDVLKKYNLPFEPYAISIKKVFPAVNTGLE
jgi:hypothetical protein